MTATVAPGSRGIGCGFGLHSAIDAGWLSRRGVAEDWWPATAAGGPAVLWLQAFECSCILTPAGQAAVCGIPDAQAGVTAQPFLRTRAVPADVAAVVGNEVLSRRNEDVRDANHAVTRRSASWFCPQGRNQGQVADPRLPPGA